MEYGKVKWLITTFPYFLLMVAFPSFIVFIGTGNLTLLILLITISGVALGIDLYIESELEKVELVVSRVFRDSDRVLSEKLPLRLMWSLRRLAKEYDDASKRYLEAIDQKTICEKLQKIDPRLNCELIEKRKMEIKARKKEIAQEIRRVIYDYYTKYLRERIGGGE